MKKAQHKSEDIKKYNRAFIKFMKPSEEETGAEENEFSMPPLPLLTLDGIKKPATDNDTKQPE